MNKTQKIATTAMLTALSIIANIFTIPLTPNASKVLSFSVLFSALTGIYLGALPAIAVGFIGDLIAHFIHPFGAYNMFIGVSCALCGLIFALIYKLKLHKLIKMILSVACCFAVCSCFLNTFGLWLQIIVGVDPGPIGLIEFFTMDKSGIQNSFWVYLAGRAPVQLLNWIVNAAILVALQQTSAIDRLFLKLNNKSEDSKTNSKTPNDD